jgi:hypothetical protein
MKNKHIKKLIKLYQKLDYKVAQCYDAFNSKNHTLPTPSVRINELFVLREELEPKFDKLKEKLMPEHTSELLDSLTETATVLNNDDEVTITVSWSEISDLLKDEDNGTSSEESDQIKELNKQIELLRLKLSEHRTLTNHPVVASDNPDLWYSDPKHQHNLGGGYPAWAQAKDQRKATVDFANEKLPDILSRMQNLDSILKGNR